MAATAPSTGALNLEPIARSVTLVHRRDRFRAHEHTVQQVLASSVEVLTNHEVDRILGSSHVQGVEVVHTPTAHRRLLPAHTIAAALGFKADLGPVQRWGLRLEKRKIAVDTTMATSVPRVFAPGDVVEQRYEALQAGLPVTEVAARFGVSRQSVHAWGPPTPLPSLVGGGVRLPEQAVELVPQQPRL